MIRIALFFVMALFVMAAPAMAQMNTKTVTTPAPVMANTDPDYAKKLDLAQQMHKIRPAKAQVQEAIAQVGGSLDPMERDRFSKMVDKAFDYDKLEKISTDTMIKLFTVAELQKMVDYFGSPEAKSIAIKMPEYQKAIQPEIIRMLDAAMIADRTNNAPPPPGAVKAAVKVPAAPAQATKP